MKMQSWFRVLFAVSLFALVPNAWGQAKHSSADVSASISTVGVHAGDKATVAVELDVHDGLHAQSHMPSSPDYIPFVLTPTNDPGLTWGTVAYPDGQDINLPELGKLNVYIGKTIIRIPVTISADAKPGPLTLAGSVFFAGLQ